MEAPTAVRERLRLWLQDASAEEVAEMLQQLQLAEPELAEQLIEALRQKA